jgi:phosphohistidine phosphatase SixA
VTVELWIVRHGAAADRAPDAPTDAERPLVAKGERQGRRLGASLPALDRLFSSPKTRAAQTAAFLAHLAEGGAEELQALADGDAEELPEAIRQRLEGTRPPPGRPVRVACVGHEPQLSEAVGLLIAPAGAGRPADLRLRKGGVARVVGRLRPGGMQLELLMSQGDLQHLAS